MNSSDGWTLLVDVGGGSIRVATHEAPFDPVTVPALGELVSTAAAAEDLAASLVEVSLRLGNPDPPKAVLVGMSGWTDTLECSRALADHLHTATGTQRVVVAHDSVSAYLGAVGLRPGVSIAAGTGVVAVGWNGSSAVKIDGWGELLGDSGGGYDIGREVLRSAIASCDGRGGSRGLEMAVTEAVGDLQDLPLRLARTPNPRSFVASFAELGAALAADGDSGALEIWDRAARNLAATAVAAAQRTVNSDVPTVDVRFTGKLFEAGDLLVNAFRQAVYESVDFIGSITEGQASPLVGAAHLLEASSQPGLRDWVHGFEV